MNFEKRESKEDIELLLQDIGRIREVIEKINKKRHIDEREEKRAREFFQILNKGYREYLRKIGISFDIVNMDESGLGLGVDIDDISTFKSYLGEELNSQELELFDEIIKGLKNQLFYSYNFEDANDNRMINFSSSVEDIVPSCKRQGRDSSLFEELLLSLKKGYLKECVELEKMRVLKMTGYTITGSPEKYRENWEKKIEILRKIKEDSMAKDLFPIIIERLKESLEIAKADIRDREIEKGSEYLIVIDEIYDILNNI